MSRVFSVGSRIAGFSSSFHTSSILFSLASKRASARNKKKNIAESADRLKKAEVQRPSVVLGTRTAEDAEKWGHCKLSKVLVDEEKLRTTTELHPVKYSVGVVHMPEDLGYGVDHAEKNMLFEHLPQATLRMTTQVRNSTYSKEIQDGDEETELRKANLLAKALDLRNANAAGIAFENRRRIIEAFSTKENPFDSGRTEVQVALLTYKIRNLWKHLGNFRRDVGNRRNLRKLVHQRARLLLYLKGYDRGRYDIILEQLALEPESIEGELVV